MSTSGNLGESGPSFIHAFAGFKKKFRPFVRVALLCVLVIGVWCLLSLPIVSYYLPLSEISSNTSGTNSSDGDAMCAAPLQYATTSGICLTEFSNILTSSNCPFDPEGNIFVVRNEEATATQLMDELITIGASAECISEAVPFLCLHLFGLCVGSNVSIQPTTSQCEEIRDKLCQQQWLFVQRLVIGLQDCTMFPTQASSCPAPNDSLSTSVTELVEEHPNGTVLECSEGFYRENGSSICIPSCYTWTQNSRVVTIFGHVLFFTSTFLGFLAALVTIIISCLAPKRMLVYPAIFIVYMTIDILALSVFVMVGYMDRNWLYCSSRSLIESRIEVTPFCVSIGIVFTYTYFQISLWWLFHITTLFWQVTFPFHAHTFETTGKNKYIHITCITLGILLPLVPIITIMADFAVALQNQNENSTSQLRSSLFWSGGLGYQPRRYPATLCIGSDPDVSLYGIVMILNITMALGCSMLIIILASLHKAHIKRRRMQQFDDNGILGYQFTFGKAEKKLLIVFCYYVVLSFIGSLQYSLYSRNLGQVWDGLERYFICEQRGHNPTNPCSRSDVESNGQELLRVLTAILLSFFPFMNLMYVVNTQELMKVWAQVRGACKTH